MHPDAGPAPLVAIVDDDLDVREALNGLFRSVGLRVELHASTSDYMSRPSSEQPSCLVLDVRLPGKSGIDFQEELGRDAPPIVFISGHADIAMSVRAMKAGAVEFLTKPVRDQDLLDAVHLAVDRHRVRSAEQRHAREVNASLARLTGREREVLAEVVAGRRNKEIAGRLHVSEATVKLHRTHIMHKLGAQSLVDLIRISDALAAAAGPSTKG